MNPPEPMIVSAMNAAISPVGLGLDQLFDVGCALQRARVRTGVLTDIGSSTARWLDIRNCNEVSMT